MRATSDAPAALAARLDQLLATEPAYPPEQTGQPCANAAGDGRPLTLRHLVFAHWRLGLGAFLLVTLIALAEQAGPRLVVTAIDQGMVRQRSMQLIAAVAACYLGAVVLTALFQRWLVQVSGRLAARVMQDLRIRIFTHLQRLSLDFYTREKAGVVMTRMTSDIENLQQLLQDGLGQIAVQGLTMIVITLLLLSMDPLLAAVTVVLTIPPLLLMSLWFRSRSTAAFLRVRDGSAAVISDLSENLRGIRVVAGHNREQHNVGHHREITGDYRDANNAAARISSVYGAGTQAIGLGSQVLLLAVGGQMVLDGTLSLGELVAFFLYFNRFFQPVQLLVQQYATYQQSRSSIIKLNALLAERPSVREAEHAAELPSVRGALRFEEVSFGYGDVPVLQGVDLDISPGETIALVGPTGAGKSTLAKLVMRLYDVSEGRVLVDGVDVREVTLSSLRRQVLLVPQEAFLFAGTLRDNLVFGRPSATEEEVRQAVAAVGLTCLVEGLPDGLGTLVRERGQALSAGERQLVALARALIAQPRVLVLDEATANLDLRSEAQVERALEAVLRDRTAILIAHRLSTAMKSDRIVVVDGGHVVECGPPGELIRAGGRFAAMHATWARHT